MGFVRSERNTFTDLDSVRIAMYVDFWECKGSPEVEMGHIGIWID